MYVLYLLIIQFQLKINNNMLPCNTASIKANIT